MEAITTGNGTTASGSIRAARRNAGLTQQQLADRASCSVDYIRLLERGYAPRYSDVFPRIVAVLGGSVSALAARRRELGITQQQLAAYANLPLDSITRIEDGEEQPDRTTSEQLASALQTSIDAIFPHNVRSPAGEPGSVKLTGAGRRDGS